MFVLGIIVFGAGLAILIICIQELWDKIPGKHQFFYDLWGDLPLLLLLTIGALVGWLIVYAGVQIPFVDFESMIDNCKQ